MINKEQLLLFSLTSCEELTNKVCEELGVKSAGHRERFADNEIFARPNVDVKIKIASLSNQHAIQLMTD